MAPMNGASSAGRRGLCAGRWHGCRDACGIKPQSVTLIGGGARSETGVRCWRISAVSSSITVRGGCGASTGRSKAGADCGESRETLIELLPQLPLEQSHLPDAQVMPLISHDVKRSVASISNFCINGVNVIPCLTGWGIIHIYNLTN